MIGSYPDPFPDELPYSIEARYFDRLRKSKRKHLYHPLYSGKHSLLSMYLPVSINQLMDDLPFGHSMTAEKAIFEQSIFPYLAIFLEKRDFDAVLTTMLTSAFHSPIIRYFKSFLTSPTLKYCPRCAKEDFQNYGQPYWHRLHQCPGIKICPKHHVWIENSEIDLSNGLEYHTAEKSVHFLVIRSKSRNKPVNRKGALLLARDTEWILNHRGNYSPAIIKEKFFTCLYEKGFITTSGFVDEKSLKECLTEYVNNNYPYDNDEVNNKVRNLFYRLKKPGGRELCGCRTFEILQIINSLGYSIEEFLSKGKIVYDLDQPYPCINPSCKNCTKQTINESLIVKEKGKERGNKYFAKITCPVCSNRYKLPDDDSFYHTAFPTLDEYIQVKLIDEKISLEKKMQNKFIVPYLGKDGPFENYDINVVTICIRKMNSIDNLKKIVLQNYDRKLWRLGIPSLDQFFVMLYYGINTTEYFELKGRCYKPGRSTELLRYPISEITMKTILAERIISKSILYNIIRKAMLYEISYTNANSIEM